MKKVIRRCIFESNSSTSHSCIIMAEEQHKEWKNKNLYYCNNDYAFRKIRQLPKDQLPQVGCLYTSDEVIEFYKLAGYEFEPDEYSDEDDPKDIFIKEMEDFLSYDTWHNDKYMEFDGDCYITPSGEKIVVECKYGWDG